LGINEIKLSKLARGLPIARRGPVILYLKICQFPLSKSLQKVPTSSFFLYLVSVYMMDYLQTIDNCASHQGHETRNIVMLKEARVGKDLWH
jgi:hypothetical protein